MLEKRQQQKPLALTNRKTGRMKIQSTHLKKTSDRLIVELVGWKSTHVHKKTTCDRDKSSDSSFSWYCAFQHDLLHVSVSLDVLAAMQHRSLKKKKTQHFAPQTVSSPEKGMPLLITLLFLTFCWDSVIPRLIQAQTLFRWHSDLSPPHLEFNIGTGSIESDSPHLQRWNSTRQPQNLEQLLEMSY